MITVEITPGDMDFFGVGIQNEENGDWRQLGWNEGNKGMLLQARYHFRSNTTSNTISLITEKIESKRIVSSSKFYDTTTKAN